MPLTLFLNLLLLIISLPVQANEPASYTSSHQDSSYNIVIKLQNHALDNDSLENITTLLWKLSDARAMAAKPLKSTLLLKKRAAQDKKLFLKALHSRGFYDADIFYHLGLKKPLTLNYVINIGKAYTINSINFSNPVDEQIQDKVYKRSEQLKKQRADAAKIHQFEEDIIRFYQEGSFYYAQYQDKSYVIDRDNKFINLIFTIEAGYPVRLSSVKFEGVKTINQEFLTGLADWEKNEAYHPDLIETTFQNLVNTNLFSQVKIDLDKDNGKLIDEKLVLAVKIFLTEKKHRTVKFSAGFSTDSGPSISSQWEHRNFFGAAEKLKLKAAWTAEGPALQATYLQRQLFDYKVDFISELGFEIADTDAYNSQNASISAAIMKQHNSKFSYSLGAGLRVSQIEYLDEQNIQQDEDYYLLYFPAKLDWITANNMFEPDSGFKLHFQLIPYQDLNHQTTFLEISGFYSHYQKLWNNPELILAGRLGLGQILADEIQSIPPDLRLYAGGGGSIRGIANQLAGPLNKKNNPGGGRSLFEAAIETRIKFNKTIGAVAFIDSGSSFADSFFDNSADIMYGTGLGLRYASPIGPLRADIAVPINKREGIDDSFQIYLSIGHAF